MGPGAAASGVGTSWGGRAAGLEVGGWPGNGAGGRRAVGLLDWVRSPSAAGLVGLAALGRGSGPEGRRVGGRVGGRGRRGGAGAYAL